jgi:hypothetical protein
VKIINVLKEDSFDEILELFRKAPEGEVFLVLPKNGRLFRREDHFAAFASEAKTGNKTVTVMTPNPDTAILANKFGFAVIANKSASKAPAKPKAKLASAPPPQDPDIRDEQDDAFSDNMTSDATMGQTPTDSEADDELNPLSGMRVVDAEGNPVEEVDEAEDKSDEETESEPVSPDSDADFVGASAAAPTATLAASKVDGVRGGEVERTMSPKAHAEKAAPVPVQMNRELDYIDAMWRDKVGKAPKTSAHGVAKLPSMFSRLFSSSARAAGGSSFPKKVAIGILLLAFFVLGSVVYATTGSAHVALSPIGKSLDTSVTVSASDTYSSVDVTFMKIPGQLLEVTKTASNTVNATGSRDVASKARGKITVTNAYSSSPQTLIATTRFSSDGGLVFRTLQSITVPGTKVVAGKTVPGTITVDVVADKPGTTYNIPAGTFKIMAFVEKGDTEKAKQFYGVSDAPMSGGASGPSTVVTQANYDAAQAAALADVKNQIKDALTAQGPELMVIDGDNPVMKDPQSTARPDDAADAVTATATGTLKTIAFRRADLLEVIRKTILSKERLVVMPDKLDLTYSDVKFNADMGALTFTVNIKGTGYAPLDLDAIKADIGGKNADDIRTYFRSKEGVLSATVTMSPFWVTSVPQNPAKITIDLNYGDSAQ